MRPEGYACAFFDLKELFVSNTNPAGFHAGQAWAKALRPNDFFEMHCARRVREFEFPYDWDCSDPLPDALGTGGLILLRLLDPNESRFVRMRSSIEELCEWCVGETYPSVQTVTDFIEGAQEALDCRPARSVVQRRIS